MKKLRVKRNTKKAMEIKDRIQSPTPKWFKRIIRLGFYSTAIGTALLSANAFIPGFTLPAKMETIAQWMCVGGLVAAAVSKTAKETSSDD